ncbi:MAG: hypothetical protein JJV93_02245 [Alphaproteobacteria bacterium]|nr:hypothetical protein [Alphaproteobacteria bacterium]
MISIKKQTGIFASKLTKNNIYILIGKAFLYSLVFVLIFYFSSRIFGETMWGILSFNDMLVGIGSESSQSLEGRICFICPYFNDLYNIVNYVASDFITLLRPLLLPMLSILLSFWLLYKVYLYLGGLFQGGDSGWSIIPRDITDDDIKSNLWAPLLKRVLVVMLVSILLLGTPTDPLIFMRSLGDITIGLSLGISSELSQLFLGVKDGMCLSGEASGVLKTGTENPLLFSSEIFGGLSCILTYISSLYFLGTAVSLSLLNYGTLLYSPLLLVMGCVVFYMTLKLFFKYCIKFIGIIGPILMLILFFPLYILSIAFSEASYVWKKGVENLIDTCKNVFLFSLEITISFILLFTIFDAHFPAPIDGYSAVIPNDYLQFSPISLEKSESELIVKENVYSTIQLCSKTARVLKTGAMDDSKYRECMLKEIKENPSTFSFFDDIWGLFFMLILGLFFIERLSKFFTERLMKRSNTSFFQLSETIERGINYFRRRTSAKSSTGAKK